jgi:hypothetical protein
MSMQHDFSAPLYDDGSDPPPDQCTVKRGRDWFTAIETGKCRKLCQTQKGKDAKWRRNDSTGRCVAWDPSEACKTGKVSRKTGKCVGYKRPRRRRSSPKRRRRSRSTRRVR